MFIFSPVQEQLSILKYFNELLLYYRLLFSDSQCYGRTFYFRFVSVVLVNYTLIGLAN